MKRTFMNKNFLLTITLSYFKEKIFLPFFFHVNLLNVKVYIHWSYYQYLEY